MASEATRTYDSLSLRDKWKVVLLLRRGRASDDPHLAKATVEFGEEWQRYHARRMRLFTLILSPIVAATIVQGVIWDDTLFIVLQSVFLAVLLGNVLIAPTFWPGRLAHSIDLSRAVLSQV